MIKSVSNSLDELRSSIVCMLIFENEKGDAFMNEYLQQLSYELEDRAFVLLFIFKFFYFTKRALFHAIFLSYFVIIVYCVSYLPFNFTLNVLFVIKNEF